MTTNNQLNIATHNLSQLYTALDKTALISKTDIKGNITYVNELFINASKYTEEQLLGENHNIVNSNHHSDEFFTDLWNTIKSGETWKGTIRNKAKDGSFYWIEAVILPLKNEQSEVIEFLNISQDITTKVNLEKDNEALQLKNKEIEQFAYVVSHDLKEPIRTLEGMTHILQMKHSYKLGEKGNEILAYILKATDRMSNLIKGLLDLSVLGTKNEIESIDSEATLEVVIEDLSLLIEKNNVQIHNSSLPKIYGYKTEFRLLLQNLIQNAIKFKRQNVTPLIKITSVETGDFYQFSVEDNGIGIRKENIDKIFKIFSRLQNSSKVEGTGIGLAHCKKIVSLHGGEIWAESVFKKGTTIFFTIPIQKNKAAEPNN
jgi:PAS domain S-box-containing protein